MGILDIDEDEKFEINRMFDKLAHILSSSNKRNEQIAEIIVKNIQKKHRTEQQLFMKLIAAIIEKYSKSNFDLRNEDSVKWAKIVSHLNKNFRYIEY